MRRTPSETLLLRLSEFVEARLGLHFPKERWNDLAQGLHSAAVELGLDRAASPFESLITSPLTKNQIEILASHLTVGETYFFRDIGSFEILQERILPELIRLRKNTDRRIRLWSAGCCTGEEPYSIAIALGKAVPDRKNWNITILATDINSRFLQKASEGVYGEWSFRNMPPGMQERYFTRTKNGRFEILPSIKEMVQFSYLNLAEDAYPSLLNNTNAMDVIVCRNVLMYFTADRARKVIENLSHSLVDGGWLIVSPSETSHILYPQFTTVNFPGVVLYRKDVNATLKVDAGSSLLWEAEETQVESVPQLEITPENQLGEPFVYGSSEIGASEPEKNPEIEAEPEAFVGVLALYQRGLYAEAEEKLAYLLSRDRDDAKLMALLARVYANEGKLSEAEEWSQKANVADKLNPGYRFLLATILQERGQMDNAMATLRQALYLDQNFPLAYFALGNLAHRRGNPNAAAKYFQNALSLLRSHPKEEILPEAEGITAGRLIDVIQSITNGQTIV